MLLLPLWALMAFYIEKLTFFSQIQSCIPPTVLSRHLATFQKLYIEG